MNVKLSWQNSTIARCARILTRAERIKVVAVVIIQCVIGLLDLLGVAIIGVLGALAVNGVQSRVPGSRISNFLSLIGIADLEFQTQAAILGSLAALLLIMRTLISVFFTKRTLRFLSFKSARISATLMSKLLGKQLVYIQKRTMQETLYAATTGVNTITLGVLGTTVWLISDSALLIILSAGLFIVDPWIALSTAIFFAAIGYVLFKFSSEKARNLGISSATLGVKSNEKIVEVISSYREAVVHNRRFRYSQEIKESRLAMADNLAETSFMPYISKYIIETSVVIGALMISAFQFLLQDAAHAVATLSVFLAAGTRIAPAVLRLQQGGIAIKSAIGSANPTLELMQELENQTEIASATDDFDINHPGFVGKIHLKDVSVTYPGMSLPALKNINLNVSEGQSVAIVGPSGAGKTTLVDVILGILEPNTGTVEISGKQPLTAISEWPGAISYVPQDVVIMQGTLRQNIELGFDSSPQSELLVNEAVNIAQLEDFVSSLAGGIDHKVGEFGALISGGQRQRLGIARALYTKPKLLVLDEATSSLDGRTEADLSESINKLRGSVTLIAIAHRLSTVRHCDVVIYMADGEILASGTFDHVRNSVPDFDHQAELMGL